HARAYTWVLVAGVLLAERNGDHIQVHLLQLIGDPRVASTYSWGSAVLAWLYKVMGRAAFFSAGSMRGTSDIGGFTLLVELWALERFPRIAERYIQGGAPPRLTPFRRAFAGYLSLSGISIRWPCTWRIYVTPLTCVRIFWLGFLSFYLCKFEQFFSFSLQQQCCCRCL
ncbi:Serine/threonine-protein phosphatase 7 long form homolog, partial [Linum perenne]